MIALLVVALSIAALADKRPYSYTPPPRTYTAPTTTERSYPPLKYEFDWSVDEDGNTFNQDEERDSDNIQGSYSVNLPDGRRLTYYVNGDSGFVAKVSYEGEARYSEESSEEYTPAYAPPTRTYDN